MLNLYEGVSLVEEADNPKNTSDSGAYTRSMRTTARGGTILAAGSLFESGGRFVIAFFLARLLGAEEYGLYTLVISTAMITAGIASFGMESALVRYVAMLAKQKDEEGVWGAIQIGIGLSTLVSIGMSIGVYHLAQPIAVGLFHEPELVPLLQLFSFIIPFLTLSNVLVGAAHGFKKMEYTAVAQNFVQLLFRLGLIVIFSLMGLSAFRAAIAFGVSDVAASVVLVYLLNRQVHWLRAGRRARRDFREILGFSLPLWTSGLLLKFRKNLQVLFLGTLSTVTNVGIYSLVGKLNLFGHIAYSSLVASVKPVLAEMYVQEDWAQMGSLYQTATRWTYMVNLPMFLVMLLFPGEILSLFGTSFVGGAAALSVLALADLINAGTGICGSIIDMTGYTRLKLLNSCLAIVLAVACNYWLIPIWGVMGAATATLAAQSSINLLRVVEVWILFRLLPYNGSFLKPTAAGLLALGASLLVTPWIPHEPVLLYLIAQVAILGLVYAGANLLLGLAPEDRALLGQYVRKLRSISERAFSNRVAGRGQEV